MLATTRELADKHNLTYRQTRYLIDQGVINPAPAKEGQAWAVSDETLWLLNLAALMRNEKIGVKTIKKFIHEFKTAFDLDEPIMVMRLGNDKIKNYTCVVWDKPNWFVYTGADALEQIIDKIYQKHMLPNGLLTKRID